MSYAAEVAADNPIHCWPMGTPSGGVIADIGSSPTNLVVTGALSDTDGIDGGTAQRFTSGVYCTQAASSGNPSGASPFSVEMWVRSASSAYMTLYSTGSPSTRQAVYIESLTATLTNFSPWDDALQVPVGLASGAWRHVVATYNGATTSKLYIDGVLLGTRTLGGVLNVTLDTIRVANDKQGNVHPFVGDLAYIAVYGAELSLARVQAHCFASSVIYNADAVSINGSVRVPVGENHAAVFFPYAKLRL